MLDVLLLIIGCILIIQYLFFGQTVTSPSIVFTFSLFFSAMVSCILQEKYSLNIELDTLLTIISGIAVFSLGEWISEKIIKTKGKSILRNSNWSLKRPFLIKTWMIYMYVVIGFLAIITIYQQVATLAESIGGGQIDADKFLMYAQLGKANELSPSEIYPWWVLMFQIVNSSLCFVALYCYLYNSIFFENLKVRTLYFLLPTVVYVFMCVFMMSRSGLIELVVYFFTVISLMWTIKYGRIKANRRIFLYGILLMIGFGAIFLYMRYLRGDGGHFDLVEDIFAYFGSEIPGLDAWMQGRFELKEPYEQYIGSHTLLGIYYFLGKIGFDVPSISRHMQFVFFNNNGYTNVYTIFLRYYMDFSYIGMLMIISLLGILYGYMHRFILLHKSIGVVLIWYSSLILAVYYSSVSELFFSSMIHPIYILRLIFSYVFLKMFMHISMEKSLGK
ncbi:O-antigen polymerase [Selenomonas montiformis]|uniref:O-antigen polymerase n=1 Tax=Selenomonas montiformis TaxID=2652285 RepID=UPI0039F571D2